jgi:hypothetical protein
MGDRIMDEEIIRLLAQIGAMKLLLGRAYTLMYSLAELPPGEVRQAHDRLLASLPSQALYRRAMLEFLISCPQRSNSRYDPFSKSIEKDLGMEPRSTEGDRS